MKLNTLLKSFSISGIAVAIDIITMYMLSHYTKLDLTNQLYISSFIKVIFLFIGHNLVTYKGNIKSLKNKALKFFPWETLSLVIVAQTVLYVNIKLEYYLDGLSNSTIENTWYLNHIVHKNKDGSYDFDTHIIILFKQLLIVIFFLLVEMRVYKYIFE
jgi:hypothetical protein